MNISTELRKSTQAALKTLYGAEVTTDQIQLQKTQRQFTGHLTIVVFPFLRLSRKKPEETGTDIGNYLKEQTDLVADFNVVKGFLNLVISPSAWISLLNDIAADAKYGITAAGSDAPLVMIEYSSPSPASCFSHAPDEVVC